MNQSILFPDIQTYDAVNAGVIFPAQQSGALIECFVSTHWLVMTAGKPLSNEQEILAQFSDSRFDLEEIAEERIEDEDFDTDGRVVIK
ncbi:DUF1488 domain-containing protein [Thaumasiovibrio subtropicus]|uniref:DUF1488 domain-containing protein n=1 Tax=Thaumasiovibrio subtropicus TaxID=1891207 RepID=UPI000B350B43|nr:DUF1488 domain-containing protein [Thaumasiovibrio subtropicus]